MTTGVSFSESSFLRPAAKLNRSTLQTLACRKELQQHPGIFTSPPPQTFCSVKGVLEKQVVLLLFHTILHPANYQTGLSALILQLSKVNTKQSKPLALLKVSQHIISDTRRLEGKHKNKNLSFKSLYECPIS